MNPFEDKLTAFAQDEVMFNTVRNEIFAQFDLNNLKVIDADNEVIGQVARAWVIAREKLAQAFKDLETYKHRGEPDKTLTNVI